MSKSMHLTPLQPCPGLSRWTALAVLILAFATAANASERRFTYSYEATTEPKGAWEYEQWVTWKTHRDDDHSFDRFDFRHEIEYGLTDKWQVALYFADWRYQDGRSVDNDRALFRDVAVETIYNLSDPTADPLGLAVYGEVKIGDEFFELEGKLIAQKNLGPLAAVYNLTLEAEYEGAHLDDDKGKIEQSAGLSYQISPAFLFGAELVHEVEFPDWSTTGHNVVYAGPNVSWRHKRWWITATQLFQVSNVHDEPDFQTRLLFGFDF